MLIYIDPQSYTNRYIKEITVPGLPDDVQLTSDLKDLKDIDIYVAGFGKVTREMIEEAGNLKVIVRNAVGTDNIDKKTAEERGIPVYNLPLVNFESVAEMTVGFMIACGRYMVFNHMNNVNNTEVNYYTDYQGQELFGRTFGIMGFGHIGKRVAEILLRSFNARVLIYDPFITAEQAESFSVLKVEDYRDLLRESDFVSIHTPLTEQTRNMINAETLKLCKKNCIIVNSARAGIIDEEALYEALASKQIFAAADDVLENYEGNKLFTLPNFIGTSHVCGNSAQARRRVGEHLLERLLTEIEKIRNAYKLR
ncbi:MAG: hypothetical protein K6A14_02750 [Erysipelotrichaceae bacterium]|nr:hypothetical protein [Erysipelotrichaceae bacterium]